MKAVVMLTKKLFDGHPKGGQETKFADSVKAGKKIHTCRDNYEYWQKKIDKLKDEGGTLCVRQWTEKPYRSPQETIAEIQAEQVRVCKLDVKRNKHRVEPYRHSITSYRATVDGQPADIDEIAKNDGFTETRDFTAFIAPLFDKYKNDTITLAIIHFNKYTYTE